MISLSLFKDFGMNALEFSTKIEKGIIRLPKQLGAYDNAYVRIIMLTDLPVAVENKKEGLRAAMQRLQEHDLFSAIVDPVAWQKQLRHDWE